ncbi:hypothetical protein FS749_011882 [Ceratobasidium sp. UAMH 11750]|nr:hypothetical protein FS749_011882 [Ceratobasidium sp. UAMH 11750]
MEVTSRVIPHTVPTVSLLWNLDPTPANVQGLAKVLVDNSLQWSKDGWGGYIYTSTSILANPKLDASAAATSLKPLTDFISEAGGRAKWSQDASFLPLLSKILAFPAPVGINGAGSSRLVPETLFTPENSSALLNATLQTLELSGGRAGFYMTTPYSYPAEPNATSVTPAWRGAVWHVIHSIVWDWDASADMAKKGYESVHNVMEPLRALTPGGGAYMNEADLYEPDASSSFWGSNYPRLLAVKQKYDPTGLLDCYNCVGWKGKTTPIASCYL